VVSRYFDAGARRRGETVTDDEVLGRVSPLFEERDVMRSVSRAFDLMKIAEEEISAAERAAPRAKKKIHGAFRYMHSKYLVRYGDGVYRAHAREIIARVKRGADLSPGTDAECLAALSEMSLRAPPSADFALAMATVFRAVFPAAPADLTEMGRESYEGRTAEILGELRRKLSHERDVSK